MSVLIVGAGPTGLTLALALKARGIPHRLIERLPAREPHSRALAVQARTLEVFEQLSLAERVMAEAVRVEGVTLHGAGGERGGSFVHVHPRLPSIVALPQDETERLLEEAGAAPERGVEFMGLVGGGAKLGLADGCEEIARADWIVGCDGAHSTVRHALGLSFEGGRYAAKLVLADTRIEGLSDARVHAWLAAGTPTLSFPLPGGIRRVIAVMPEDAPDPPDGSMAPFAAVGRPMSPPSWWSRFRISARQVPAMRRGNVLLCGDAAHIHSPAGGQGMNLGIQDAWALAAALERGGAAIDAWAAERHAVARRVIRLTDAATRMAMLPSPLLARLRTRVMGLALGTPWFERRVEHTLAGLDYPPISG